MRWRGASLTRRTRPASHLALLPLEAAARAGHRCERLVSRSFPPPGVSSGWCPFPTVSHFYRFSEPSARAFPGLFHYLFLSTLFPQITARFPQAVTVFHRITHTISTLNPHHWPELVRRCAKRDSGYMRSVSIRDLAGGLGAAQLSPDHRGAGRAAASGEMTA